MAEDFTEEITGDTYYIAEDMVDEFIQKYVPLALAELRNIQKGVSLLRPEDYTWIKKV